MSPLPFRFAAALVLVLAAAAVPARAATPPPGPPYGQAPPSAATVTLITGDVVEYAPGRDGGRPAVSIRQAPRPGGEDVTFLTRGDADGGYLVMPSDAAAMVGAGTLDEELFDVVTLAREQRTDAIPLVVTYGGDPAPSLLSRSAGSLPAAEDVRVLDSVNGAAVSVDAAKAAAFWAGLREDRPGLAKRSASGIAKVWLDRATSAALDKSVPLVGAPTAWKQGFDGTGVKVAILDSGLDLSHPDLAGRVVATKNFTSTPDIGDRDGHGTLVASTAAGAGQTYRGVAPAASLLIGKVLDDTGHGTMSGTIQGMQWAAAQGAAVVNMSLGWCCNAGTDPVSQSLNALTKTYGTLFVVAANNSEKPLSIAAPAAADEALAVGAADKETGKELPAWSARGPRLGDAAVKPNLVAPGVDIIAARSSQSQWPPMPGDDRYGGGSGTSLSSPHVAGAAALLAQQHPDWKAAELRDALTSTANRNDAYNWFDQGSGLLDVGRAVTQTVFATSSVDFHQLDGAATKQVTYRNTGAEPVTLTVSLLTRGWSGKPAPEGAVKLGAETVTVPANGTATVDLAVDPKAGVPGAYGGWVTAEAGQARVVTPFSYYAPPPRYTVKLSMINSYGAKEFETEPSLSIFPWKQVKSPEDPYSSFSTSFARGDLVGNAELRLPAGEYEVFGSLYEKGLDNRDTLAIRRITVDGDESVTLDAREAVRIRPDLGIPVDGASTVRYTRDQDPADPDDHPTGFTVQVSQSGGYDLYVTPVTAPKSGTIRLSQQWAMTPPALTKATAGRLTLHPVYTPADLRALPVTPAQAVVPVGRGKPEDFDGVDVTGKLVLVGATAEDAARPYASAVLAMDRAGQEAARRGAAGIVGYVDVDGARARVPYGTGVRLGLSAAEGRALRAALDAGPVPLRLDRYAGPDVVYNLRFDTAGRVPTRPLKAQVKDLARVDSSYYADVDGDPMRTHTSTAVDGNDTVLSLLNLPVLSQRRTEYYGPATGDVVWTRAAESRWLALKTDNRFTRHDRLSDEWFKAPLVPGAADLPRGYPATVPCGLCRDGDRFVPGEQWRDSDPSHHSDPTPVTSQPKLFVDGKQAGPIAGYNPRYFTVPAQAGPYRLEAVDTTNRTLSRKVTTTMAFTSTTPPEGTPRGYTCAATSCAFQPVIQFGYDLPLDLRNRAPAGRRFAFDLTAGTHSALRRPPALDRVTVEYSVDDGATWQPAGRVTRHGRDRYRVELTHPALAGTTGFVSLRVTAADRAGGSTTQTIERAYGLA